MDAKNLFKPIAEKPIQAWCSNRLQIFDIVDFVVRELGGGTTAYFSTYSTSEEFIRKIFRLKEKNMIENAYLYLDFSIAHRFKKLLPMVQNVFDKTFIITNHSKIYLFQNGNKVCTVLTSQNQTRGIRNESGIITTDPEVHSLFLNTFIELEKTAVNVYNILQGTNRNNS